MESLKSGIEITGASVGATLVLLGFALLISGKISAVDSRIDQSILALSCISTGCILFVAIIFPKIFSAIQGVTESIEEFQETLGNLNNTAKSIIDLSKKISKNLESLEDVAQDIKELKGKSVETLESLNDAAKSIEELKTVATNSLRDVSYAATDMANKMPILNFRYRPPIRQALAPA